MVKRVSAVASAVLLVLILASCAMEPSGPRLEGSPLVGKWKSGVEYRESDFLYDYGATITIFVRENGNAEVTQDYYIKNRGDEVWTKDLSSKPKTATYGLWDYPEAGGLKGRAELCDAMTFSTIYDFQYEVTEERDRLLLKGKGGAVSFNKIQM